MGATRAAAAAAAVILGLAVSGCSSSGDDSSTAPTSATSGPPSSSDAPTTTNPSQDAQSQAVALVPAYLRMLDDLRLDPSRPLDDIYQVAVAPEATAQASAVGELRSRGYRQTGLSRVVTAAVVGVPESSGAAAPSSALLTVVVNACVDVRKVGAINAAGQSVIPPGRPDFLIEQLTVVNPRYPDASSWRVSGAVNRQAQSCSG